MRTDYVYRTLTDPELVARIHGQIGCGPIVTEDDPSDDPNGFDPTILGPTPNKLHYGYCPACHATWRWDVPEQRWVPYAPVNPSITCPRCHRTTYHPADIEAGYCGACHDWTTVKPDRFVVE